jgi:hypothetical protein
MYYGKRQGRLNGKRPGRARTVGLGRWARHGALRGSGQRGGLGVRGREDVLGYAREAAPGGHALY